MGFTITDLRGRVCYAKNTSLDVVSGYIEDMPEGHEIRVWNGGDE